MTTTDTIQIVADETPESPEVGETLIDDEQSNADAPIDGIQIMQVDPTTVKIETNVRTQAAVGQDFVRSIKRHGVLVPVLAYRDEDGTVVVRDGQRRVLAAIQADRRTVPAYLVAQRDEERLRIVQQMVTNAHREGLTDTEEANAMHALTLEGLTPTMIAKELAVKPARVKVAVAVAENEKAKDAVAKYEVTFEEALVIAEFEDDPEAVKALRRAAEFGAGDFAHEAQRQQDKKAAREALTALIAEYEAKDLHLIAWPAYDDKVTRPFSDLTLADGTALTEENYIGSNGYRFAVRETWRGIEVGHFVTDWKQWGLKKRKADGTANTPWTDEQKVERKELIANNKAWDSAEKVRRAWLATFLSRKSLPKDAATFATLAVVDGAGALGKQVTDHHPVAAELLGLSKYEWGKPNPLATHIEHQPSRVGHVLLAVAAAAHEASIDKHTWRNPSKDATRYFTALAAWGYTLSDVEQIVLGVKVAEPVEDEVSDVGNESDEDDLAA